RQLDDPAARAGVATADERAGLGALVLAPAETAQARAFVGRGDPGARRWIVELPPPFGANAALEWRLADLVVAASLAAADADDRAGADALFAKAVRR
ncbi:MAG: hypothetical protein QM602_07980, partial [Microbacterium sp.]